MDIIKIKNAVNHYQCPGCVNGVDTDNCDSVDVGVKGCAKHTAGTMILGGGVFALGVPKGFNRFGPNSQRNVEVWESYEVLVATQPNLTTIYSVPVWKHLDDEGNTIVRWFSPRTNYGWSTVILGNCLDKLPNALLIGQEELDYMD